MIFTYISITFVLSNAYKVDINWSLLPKNAALNTISLLKAMSNLVTSKLTFPLKEWKSSLLATWWVTPIANGRGCSYLKGVKIGDLVPFRVFSVKIRKMGITGRIFLNWLVSLEHIDKGAYIFWILLFLFFVFELVPFRGKNQLLSLPLG